MKMFKRLLEHDFIRFCIVGVVNTAVDFAAFSILFYSLRIDAVPANIVSFGLAMTNSYLLNKVWSFRGNARAMKFPAQYALFVVVSLCGLAMNTGILVLGMYYQLPPLLAKVLGAVIAPVWNFLGYRYLVFRA